MLEKIQNPITGKMVKINGSVGTNIITDPIVFPNLKNPVSGKLVSRKSKVGKRLLLTYQNQLKSGGTSSFAGVYLELDDGEPIIFIFI